MNDKKVTALDENNNEIIFTILDNLTLNNEIYVIVTEEDENNNEIKATILKQIKNENNYITYSFIENEKEFIFVMEKFRQNDEYDIELE